MDPSGVRGQVVEPPDFSLGCDYPPVAEAGPNQTLECSSQAGASVTLDGSASTDADSTPGTNDDIVLFEWYEDYGLPSQRPLGSGEVITVALSVGIHNITLVVTDSAGATNDDTMVLEVQDTTAPVIQCPANVTLEANGACQATYGGPPATATDSCDDSPVVTSVPPLPATFSGLGDHAIPWTATDESGNTATCTQTVTIIDTTLPVIACPADVTTECRGPSGAPVTLVASAADNCDPNPVITNSFTAGGPDASSVYPIGITQVIFTARDASGNTSSCTAKVTVIDTQCPVITNIRELRESLEHHCFFSEPSVPAEAWDLCDPSPDIQIHFQSVPDTPCDRAVTIEARDDFGNLCPETILFYQDPNDCDRDGIPDCVRCDAAFGFACFSVNRLEIRRKLAERNRADDSMDSKGSFHLFLCPAGTDAGDSRLDIEDDLPGRHGENHSGCAGDAEHAGCRRRDRLRDPVRRF